MTLRSWMKSKEVYDKDLEDILDNYGISDPDNDFKKITEDEWDEIYRQATVERFKELKDQETRARLEKKLNKIEKEWRLQSGIKKTNIKNDMDMISPKLSGKKGKKELSEAPELKKFLLNEEMFEKDLFETLVEHTIITVDDIMNINEQEFDDIIRQVRVLRVEELKDQKSKHRLENILSKFEKYWRSVSGIKKSNIKNDLDEDKKEEAPKVKANQKMKDYSDLKQWMQEKNMWEKDLFDTLILYDINNENDIQNMTEDIFDDIVRKVRVERFSAIKDQATRSRLDKLLTNFEKEWRILSGIKKTNIKNDLDDNKKEDNPKSQQNKKLAANKELKEWMQQNNIWEKDLFDILINNNITCENDIKNMDETKFDDIVRKVRVERFSAIKDQSTRKRLDNLLANFEKEWRKLSGIKKSSIKDKTK